MTPVLRLLLPLLAAAVSCGQTGNGGSEPLPKALAVVCRAGGNSVLAGTTANSIDPENPGLEIEFSREVDLDMTPGEVHFSGGDISLRYGSNKSIVSFRPMSKLEHLKTYTLELPAGEHFGVNLIEPVTLSFSTRYDRSDKFPRISDEELLTLVQKQTFKFFWDYAHPVSGLARERLGSDDTVTSGGSGFGIMTLPVAVERGFITREQAAERLRTIVDFLQNKAQRFHGAYSHWLNGSTGKAIAFSQKDNGGDLVETAFLIQGLLTVAQYFNAPAEADIRNGINAIWRDVEWDWYTQGGQDVLYWHWSPDYGWDMNMKITGWNEALIIYVLAASSPTHTVPASVYHKGWARNGAMRNDYNGPLFFTHYSFLGLDPRSLKDSYADYWEMNTAHARRNHDYCAANPNGHAGYSSSCWGLTASDIPGGYSASAPSNDLGVIAPTAAISSIPYTPEESLDALHEFYYVYGDRLWGKYGFFDAFCLDQNWFAPSYIAIDQGPIVVMIENYRSGLLWDLFMKTPDLSYGLDKLGFSR